jgi:hypothetical protein
MNNDELWQELRSLRADVEENQRLLKKLYSASVWSRVFRAVYWFVIIGIALGTFYFLKPYLDSLTNIYGQVQGLPESGFTVPF